MVSFNTFNTCVGRVVVYAYDDVNVDVGNNNVLNGYLSGIAKLVPPKQPRGQFLAIFIEQ